MTNVLVLGATGEMGGRVCRLIRRWAPNAVLVGANKSGTGHVDFPVRTLDIHDSSTLWPAFRGMDLVVNAVGPYRYDPTPVVRTCVDARCNYVDLSEDLDFLASVERAARARGAQRAGVFLVPGCSTVPALVQLVASSWVARGDVSRVSAWLSMGSANPASRGLVAGLLGPLGRPLPDGARAFTSLEAFEVDANGRAGRGGRTLRFGRFPAPYPSRGLRLGDRRVPVRFYAGFDRGWVNRLLAVAAPVLGRLPARFVEGLAGPLLPLLGLVRPLGTQQGVLAVLAEDANGRELERVEIDAPANGLDIPAAPSLWVTQALLAGAPRAKGVVGLERIVKLENAAAWLRESGYVVRGA